MVQTAYINPADPGCQRYPRLNEGSNGLLWHDRLDNILKYSTPIEVFEAPPKNRRKPLLFFGRRAI